MAGLEKRKRGRPPGDQGIDDERLQAIADMLFKDGKLGVAAAVRALYDDPKPADTRRLQAKWRDRHPDLLADAERRAKAAEPSPSQAVSSVGSRPRAPYSSPYNRSAYERATLEMSTVKAAAAEIERTYGTLSGLVGKLKRDRESIDSLTARSVKEELSRMDKMFGPGITGTKTLDDEISRALSSRVGQIPQTASDIYRNSDIRADREIRKLMRTIRGY